jgi:hypothetical protein
MTTENSTPKQRPGFQPGQSGNPKGKPRGTRNATLIALDAIGSEGAQEILQKAVELAKAGDARSMEIILQRIWPVRKGRPVALDLPAVTTAQNVQDALAAVIEAMGEGEITPDEAAAVSSIIETQRRTIETLTLEQRIEALEGKTRENAG